MNCPDCVDVSLQSRRLSDGAGAEVCGRCGGAWFDRGGIYEFTDRPEVLEKALCQALDGGEAVGHCCPRCETALERGRLDGHDVPVEQCRECGGVWLTKDSLATAARTGLLPWLDTTPEGQPARADSRTHQAAHERLRDLGAGLLALPNLILRSVFTLGLLYGVLGLVLISLVLFAGVNETLVLGIGIAIAVLQFALGPWIMDLSLRWAYRFEWLKRDEIPEHLEGFIARVCEQEGMKFPHFGLIDDGAPTAFTYGHVPSNARIVVSRGLLELLESEESEAVVAHEIGHARNWDMALMTMAQLVPLLLFYIYRVGFRLSSGRGKGKEVPLAVAVGAYVLWILSEYVVLWFSRTREYFADRFAGKATGNPNALAMALVKIAYGLAATPKKVAADKDDEDTGGKKKKAKKAAAVEPAGLGAVRALNIFDDRAATALVMASATGQTGNAAHPPVESVKSAMQWDLWNPWAKWYELNSTHPLVANRLRYLADQAAHQGQVPVVVFDRKQPESYWDDFLVDFLMMALPWLGLLAGLGVAAATMHAAGLGLALVLAGLGLLIRTGYSYRRDFFPHLSVAALLHRVKVSRVRPVPATLTGEVIGKGVPGLIWSEDFVMRDRTGILFLDYSQPLPFWNFFFGLLKAERYQGREVRVTGWFRRAPVPYFELLKIETVDGSQPVRRSWTRPALQILGGLLIAGGAVLAVLSLLG